MNMDHQTQKARTTDSLQDPDVLLCTVTFPRTHLQTSVPNMDHQTQSKKLAH
ncbi:hypothetical protein CRENBAI_024052 [Crenichthys baileyi]|uniref:Uncharacterized protein n=1 Tax=Crenichthys baileyi TaxID=28760 RepID=A0AAV9RFB2_9TELE